MHTTLLGKKKISNAIKLIQRIIWNNARELQQQLSLITGEAEESKEQIAVHHAFITQHRH